MPRKPGITGKTLIIPMIGHPMAQVKTPGPLNIWFTEQNIDAAILPMDIRPERVASFFEVLRATENCVGCSITMPHKQAAFAAADEVSERARRAKSVNIIRRTPSGRLIGDMTDGIAMLAALRNNGISVTGQDVLLIGAGAAGTSIALEIAGEGATSLTILERDQMRRRAIVTEIEQLFPQLPVFQSLPADRGITVAINASTAGMNPRDPLPCSLDQLPGVRILADAVTKPSVTAWLNEGISRGIRIQPGEEMALAQVPIQLHYLRFLPEPVLPGVAQLPDVRHGVTE